MWFIIWILKYSVDSPISANNPKGRDDQARIATSGSSHEQSDDDVEIEAGPCEQSTDPLYVKRFRRYFLLKKSSNYFLSKYSKYIRIHVT